MSALEIILLIAGCIIVTLGFVIPDKKDNTQDKKAAEEEVKKLVASEMEGIKAHVDEVVNESIEYAVEKTERSLERLTNEKIMAVNEYSDTVLAQIHKDHEEVMFLYDMLNDKHANIKDTASKVDKAVKQVAETTREAEAAVEDFKRLTPPAVAVPNAAETEKVNEPRAVTEKTSRSGTATAKAAGKRSTAGTSKAAGAKAGKAGNTPDTFAGSSDSAADAEVPVMNFTGTDRGADTNARILELHGKGKSNVAIARELGLGVGEVKLVVDLYKNL